MVTMTHADLRIRRDASKHPRIDGVKTKPLRLIPDERGCLMEILRADERELFTKFGQVYVSATYPGVVKAWHYHQQQIDNFACVAGMVKLVLVDTRAGLADQRRRQRVLPRHAEPDARAGAEPRLSRLEVHQPRDGARRERADRAVPLRRAGRVPARRRTIRSLRLDPQGWLRSSSPAAPASSAATSSATRCARIADWRVTTLDKLTYAGRRENLHDVMDDPRHAFVHGDIGDAAVSGPLVERSDIVVHFAAETHVDRSIMAAGEFIRTDVEGHVRAARGGAARAGAAAVRADLDRRGLRQRADRREPRDRRAEAAQSRMRRARPAPIAWPTATGPPTTCRSIITRASNNYGPVPVSREGHPAVRHQRRSTTSRCRSTATAGTSATGCTSTITAARIDLLIDAGRERRGLQHRRRQRGHERRPDAPDPRRLLGKPPSLIKPVADRPGHDRRYCLDTDEAARARLDAAGAVRGRAARDRRLVSRQRVVVAADQGTATPRSARTTQAQYGRRADSLSMAVSGPVLVTGAAGFAGSHLLEHLAGVARRRRLGAIGRRRPSSRRSRAGSTSTCSIATRVRAAIARAAAVGGLPLRRRCRTSRESWRTRAAPLASNVLGTHHLLDALRRARRAVPRPGHRLGARSTRRRPAPIDEDARARARQARTR